MIILTLNEINMSFGTNTILEDVTFNIQENDKVGIVGVNGAGKTTLFKLLSGELSADSGDIFIAKGLRTGFLAQETVLESENSVWDELLTTFRYLLDMEKRMKELELLISAEKDAILLERAMKEYSDLSEKYSQSGGFEYNSRVRGVLKGLGFSESQFGLEVKALSGGQKTRLALGKLLLEEPDILLLDEPTNHLDLEAIEWLEDYLKAYKKCIMIISHDRYFLDSVTNRTIELQNNHCKSYAGNYSAYMKQKAQDRAIQQKRYDLQQKEIARLEAFIEQQRRWNRERNIIAAESRQKAIDRMEKIDRPENDPGSIRIKFRSGIISGNDVIFVEGLKKHFPGIILFDDISFNMKRNERAFILGPNGCGKSTLLKIIAGRAEKTSGEIEFGHKITIGYYDQELADLNEMNTVIEEVWNDNEKLTHTQIRSVLAAFLFTGEDVFKKINVLSGGEKSRVALAKLMLSGSNFLLLDEPTNHLDINSREALEEALLSFDGTILAVSHDRYFIGKLATRIFEFSNKNLNDYKGDYNYYLDHRKKAIDNTGFDEKQNFSQSKLQRIESKEEKARKKKLEKRLSETEAEIVKLESRLSEINREMENFCSDHVRLVELDNEKSGAETRLEELLVLWEELLAEKEQEAVN